MIAKQSENQTVYYAADDILFFVEQDRADSFSAVNSVADLRAVLSRSLDALGTPEARELSALLPARFQDKAAEGKTLPARLTFTREGGAPFSLFTSAVTQNGEGAGALARRFYETIRAARGGKAPTYPGLDLLDGQGQRQGYLRLASPNWLTGGAPGHVGTGGPGGQPVATASGDVDDPAKINFKLPPAWHTAYKLDDPAAQPVDVFVLDTLPTVAALTAAWAQWGPGGDHTLRRLLMPGLAQDAGGRAVWRSALADFIYGGALTPAQDFADVAGLIIEGHDYDMADHGLFAAGVVNRLAPEARLYLIEVLNHFGVGSLAAIAAGLHEVASIHQASGRPAVVNCSFTLSIPVDGHPADAGFDLGDLLDPAQSPDFVADMRALLNGVFQATDANIMVVAAAGNDSNVNTALPARYPAAAAQVIGVGALGTNQQRAAYSNRADNPFTEGVTTYGGDPGAGVISGYCAASVPDMPGGAANGTGYARWAGTSFASPVVSGALALLVGRGGLSLPDARTAIFDAVVEGPGQEQVLPITQ